MRLCKSEVRGAEVQAGVWVCIPSPLAKEAWANLKDSGQQ